MTAPATSLIGISPKRKPINFSIWVLPVIVVAVVAGCFIYISTAQLDDLEARALSSNSILNAFVTT